MNPYGAVPAALKETRLALSDIMKDYLGHKILESKTKVALADVEAAKSMAEISGQKDILQARTGLAKVEAEGRRFEAGHALDLRKVTEAETAGSAMRDWRTEDIKLKKSRDVREKEEFDLEKKEHERLTKEYTPAEISGQLGLGKLGNSIFMKLFPDPNVKLPMKQYEKIQKWIQENPKIAATQILIGLHDTADGILAKINNGTATDQEKQALGKITNTLKMLNMAVADKKMSAKDLLKARQVLTDGWDMLSEEDQIRQEYLKQANGDETEARDLFIKDGINQLSEISDSGPLQKQYNEIQSRIKKAIGGKDGEGFEVDTQVNELLSIKDTKQREKALSRLKELLPADIFKKVSNRLKKEPEEKFGIKGAKIAPPSLSSDEIKKIALQYGRYRKNGQTARIKELYEKHGDENMAEVVSFISNRSRGKSRFIRGGITG